jgi:Flp pilus assembly pilin Flp
MPAIAYKIFRSLALLAQDEEGATAIEYTMIACIFAVMAIGAATAFGNAVTSQWIYTATTIDAAGGP